MNELIVPLGESQISTYEELLREYLDDRILVFNDEVDDNVVENYIMYILKWNKEDIDIPVEKRKKIRLYITSPGGSSFSASILCDVISQSKTPIIGIALDLVASAAYIIYLACQERIAFVSSSFLQHEGDVAIENSRSKFKQTSEFFDQIEDRQKQFIISHTNMTEEFYDKIYDQEYWMTAEKAKEHGVVDKIIGIDCELDEVLF